MTLRFKPFLGHLAAALASVAAFHFTWREVTYKLADSVLVYADRAGFVEVALERPFGAVDWLVRILAATNLTWWGILVQLALVAAASTVAYLALRHRGSKLAPFAPWFAAAVFVLPTLALGEDVWMLRHPQFPQMHLLWFTVLAGCLFAGWKGVVGFIVIPFVIVGIGKWFYYDLPADDVLWFAWNLPIVQAWDFAALGVVGIYIMMILFAFVPIGRRRRADPTAADVPRMWIHGIAPALFAVAYFIALPARDTRDQLEMERAVVEGRFADVLKIAPKKANPKRMETAWRILAMFRLGTIDRDLYRFPIIGSHHTSTEEEMVMEGPLLYFNYGFVLSARRWAFETLMTKGMRPQMFRLLGDCALITGEEQLARKNFKQLARCPFRGGFAAHRLAAMDMDPIPDDAFADLIEVANFNHVWCSFEEESGMWQFVSPDVGVERAIYAQYLRLKDCPPQMLKMVFASALLNEKPELLRENAAAMKALYPDGRIGQAFLEAMRE